MASLTKLSIPLTLAATLLVSAVGAGATYGATVSQLHDVTTRLDLTSRRVDALETEVRAQREWRARVETSLEYIARTVDRLEQRLSK